MAKCKRCGKFGLFLKINNLGLCQSCQIEELSAVLDEIGGKDTLAAKRKTEEYNLKYNELVKKCEEETSRLISLEKEIASQKKEIIVHDEIIELESFALYLPKFKFLTSDEYKDKLNSIREKQKMLIKEEKATTGGEGWTVNGKIGEGKKMIIDMKKLLLRSFNNECDYCVDNVKFNNIEASQKRITKSFETINKLGTIMRIKISDEYRKLKLDGILVS